MCRYATFNHSQNYISELKHVAHTLSAYEYRYVCVNYITLHRLEFTNGTGQEQQYIQPALCVTCCKTTNLVVNSYPAPPTLTAHRLHTRCSRSSD